MEIIAFCGREQELIDNANYAIFYICILEIDLLLHLFDLSKRWMRFPIGGHHAVGQEVVVVDSLSPVAAISIIFARRCYWSSGLNGIALTHGLEIHPE